MKMLLGLLMLFSVQAMAGCEAEADARYVLQRLPDSTNTPAASVGDKVVFTGRAVYADTTGHDATGQSNSSSKCTAKWDPVGLVWVADTRFPKVVYLAKSGMLIYGENGPGKDHSAQPVFYPTGSTAIASGDQFDVIESLTTSNQTCDISGTYYRKSCLAQKR